MNSGKSGQHLEIGEELKMMAYRPISHGAEVYQKGQNFVAFKQSGCKLNY